jgi:molybdenum cofactor cytidylyltransferase
MAFVSGVILAAGRSRRLGRPKQLLDLGGQPLLAHVVRNAVASGLGEVILVLGHEAGRIAEAIGERGQRVVVNPDHAAGQSTSVRVGLGAVAPRAEAVVFLLGDQPTVDTALIDRLIERFGASGSPIVQPAYGGRPGNPVLFARELFPELAAVEGDEGARSVVRRHQAEVATVAVERRPPRDVDTEEDYRALLAEWPA